MTIKDVQEIQKVLIPKDPKRKTIKPNDSSFIVWLVTTLLTIGIIIGTIFTNNTNLYSLHYVFIPGYFVISVMYLYIRASGKKMSFKQAKDIMELLSGGKITDAVSGIFDKDGEKGG
jgi:hypothetical protein